MGEAAAVLVLEELEHAQARGAKIYAELVGYGVSSDAAHMTEPDPTGESPARAMTMAFADAGVDPSEIGYVNAHATSTPLGDSSRDARDQARARRGERAQDADLVDEGRDRTLLRRCGRDRGGLHGARRCATGSFRRRSTSTSPIPNCDLDYIPNEARDAPGIEVACSNSFGFGGHNACIVVRRFR